MPSFPKMRALASATSILTFSLLLATATAFPTWTSTSASSSTSAYNPSSTSIPATLNITASNIGIGALEWHGQSKGVNITLYGYAHEIRSQLMALDPEWVPVTSMSTTTMNSTVGFGDFNDIEEREARYPVPYGMFCCPVNTFTPIPWTDAQLAVNALNEIGGECIARSNSCGLAENPRACQGGAAVVVCNDSSEDVIRDCTIFAKMAGDIITTCSQHTSPNGCGQYFDDQTVDADKEWNVVIDAC